jgi:methylenetetrahydrofolate reductase (NADPH)
MRFSEAYGAGKFGLSFELFPPKTPDGDESLFRHLTALVPFQPDVITCTYGAGGSTRHRTLDIVTRVRSKFSCSVAAHLTCVGSTVAELRDFLDDATRRNIENIVALRGDPPRGQSQFRPVSGGLAYANELVALVRGEFPHFGIAVAGYPETHQEAASAEDDLRNLKRKVDRGADVVLTQLFYNNDDFFRFRDHCAAEHIDVPIVPGLLPVTNLAQIQRIASLCAARLPATLVGALEDQAEDVAGQFEVGVEFAIRQTHELIAGGAPGLHWYVLNKSEAAVRVLESVTLPGRARSKV